MYPSYVYFIQLLVSAFYLFPFYSCTKYYLTYFAQIYFKNITVICLPDTKDTVSA